MTVLRWFEDRAAAAPDSLAVLFDQEQVSYGTLNRRAACVAGALRDAGVREGDLVGLFVHRSPDMLAALLGIWKAGAAYVPLDPAHPSDRIAFMLEDASARFLITEPELERGLAKCPSHALYLHDLLHDTGRLAPSMEPSPARLAYVMYTSGSTGRPKGAMITHGGLAAITDSVGRLITLSPDDVMFACTTITFDPSNTEMFVPLVAGAAIYLTERDCARDAQHMSELLRRSGATAMFGTPTTFRLLLQTGWTAPESLKMMSGGEALPVPLARALASQSRYLWNFYGPTEASIWATQERIQANVEKVTIGRPFDFATVYVLDKSLRRVPPGTIGDLYIGGKGVGLGYHNRPELTEACFVPDPFSHSPGARMYRTGDLAVEMPDGRIDFLGRADDQVKMRGFRIELGEIEALLTQREDVLASVVRLIELEPGDDRLIAFVISKGGATDDDYRAWLKQKLPPYMVPSEFIRMEKFPIAPTGKVDRKALDRVRLAQAAPAAQTAAAANDAVVAKLTAIWQRFLKVGGITPTSNFFEIGGHSLLAARMIAEIERQFDRRLPISALVQRPTIASLAAFLRLEQQGDWPGLAIIKRGQGPAGARRTPLFVMHGLGGSLMSFRQLAEEMDPAQTVCGLQLPLRLPEGFDTGLIEKLAARYVEEVRTEQPIGPYCLAGHSSGGEIVFEMARQLTAMGQRIGLLALLDSDYEEEKNPTSPFHNWAWFKASALGVWKKTLRFGLREVIRRRLTHEKLMMQIRLTRRMRSDQGTPERLTTVDSHIALGLREYHPDPYHGDVVLFVAGDELRSHREPTMGWSSKVLGRLEVVEIPGIHDTILSRPEVKLLAREVDQRLCAVCQQRPVCAVESNAAQGDTKDGLTHAELKLTPQRSAVPAKRTTLLAG